MEKTKSTGEMKKAYWILFLFGMISLLGDISYESARSINGPYLNLLKANAITIGWIIGISEFLSYAVRLISGYFSDQTKAHWFFTILGYSTLVVIPLLSFSNTWEIAAILIFIERIGKGIRSPSKDTIISFAAKKVGTGFGFGISEFLDQFGAFLGPILFALFFYSQSKEIEIKDYQEAYRLLWIPYLILMIVLFFTYLKFREPEQLEKKDSSKEPLNIHKIFWLYNLFIFFTTIGSINFGIIGYHLKVREIANDYQIPLLYASAMLIDAIIGIGIGKYYDHIKIKTNKQNKGIILLLLIPLCTSASLSILLVRNFYFIILGIIFWGAVLGLHETLMKAVITDLSSIKSRATIFGIFHVVYGLSLFVGSTMTGYLYEISVLWLCIIMIGIEMISIFVFFQLKNEVQS